MGTRTCAECPQQRYVTGEPGKVQGRERVVIVEGHYGYRARRVSMRGKFVLSRNTGYKTGGGGRHVVKRSSEPRVAYPSVKVQVWDLVFVVEFVVPLDPWGSVLGENSFYRAPLG